MVSPVRLAVYAAALAVASAASAELHLTPTISEYELDGVKLQRLAFFDGATTVTYQPPKGWNYSGNATQLRLHPQNKAQAEATVTRVPRSQPGAFDEDGIKKLVSQAVATIPKDSVNVSVVSQEKNPIKIQRKETLLVTLSYTLYGQHFSRSILFLYRGKEQIRSQLTCLREDFPELQRAFFVSQYTWQQL